MTFCFIAALAIIFAIAIYHRRRSISFVEEGKLETPVTDKDIKQVIRTTEAPKLRPYAGGEYGNDQCGRSYVAGTDGALRRVVVVPTVDGMGALMQFKKLDKAERKRRKKALQRSRNGH